MIINSIYAARNNSAEAIPMNEHNKKIQSTLHSLSNNIWEDPLHFAERRERCPMESLVTRYKSHTLSEVGGGTVLFSIPQHARQRRHLHRFRDHHIRSSEQILEDIIIHDISSDAHDKISETPLPKESGCFNAILTERNKIKMILILYMVKLTIMGIKLSMKMILYLLISSRTLLTAVSPFSAMSESISIFLSNI